MHALLISTYEMGRQPFGLASPAAWLRAAGWAVTCVDVAKERLRDEVIAGADLIGFHLPMHTATRLAVPIIGHARRLNSSARICAYGLYAPLNAEWLRSLGVDDVLGGEFEEALTSIARTCGTGLQACDTDAGLKSCATTELPDAGRWTVGAERTRGASLRTRGAGLQPCAPTPLPDRKSVV